MSDLVIGQSEAINTNIPVTSIEYFTLENNNTVRFKKLSEKATTPTYGSEDAAGMDLYAALDESVKIPVSECVKIPTNIAIEIPKGYVGLIYPRSGLATKKGLRLQNGTGVIDADYRGDCIVALYNDSNSVQVVEPNDRIAQMVIMPYLKANLLEVSELEDTERSNKGFGSTGK